MYFYELEKLNQLPINLNDLAIASFISASVLFIDLSPPILK